MTQEQLDQIGEIADRCDNLAHAARLPMPPEFHVTQLTRALANVRDQLRALYVEASGDNPWEGQ